MKIGINTLSVTPDRGGVKTYLVNLVGNLSKLDIKNDYFLYVTPINKILFEELGDTFQYITIPMYSDNRLIKVFYEQFILPFLIQRDNIDILFSPGNITSLLSRCKKVITVHDMGYKMIPSMGRLKRFYYNIIFPASAKNADIVITPSCSSATLLKKNISEIRENKIKVVYEGSKFKPKQKVYEEKRILFVSTLYKYKRADSLIKSFSLLVKKYECNNFLLVIVGQDINGQKTILEKIADDCGVIDKVIFKGMVSDKELSEEYQKAMFFVYPSAHEGFGLPVLEAMSYGVPVIASNRMSVPEVAGDAALIVDPDNIKALAEAMHKMIIDEKLREYLVKKGYKRVEYFSWEKAAKKTLAVFENVYKNDKGLG